MLANSDLSVLLCEFRGIVFFSFLFGYMFELLASAAEPLCLCLIRNLEREDGIPTKIGSQRGVFLDLFLSFLLGLLYVYVIN